MGDVWLWCLEVDGIKINIVVAHEQYLISIPSSEVIILHEQEQLS